jgi:hypothetical protein
VPQFVLGSVEAPSAPAVSPGFVASGAAAIVASAEQFDWLSLDPRERAYLERVCLEGNKDPATLTEHDKRILAVSLENARNSRGGVPDLAGLPPRIMTTRSDEQIEKLRREGKL